MSSRAAVARLGTGARSTVLRLVRLTGAVNIALMAGSGAVAALALPPLGIVPALFAFSLLMLSLEHRRSAAGAFAGGWAFAFGHHVAGLYWISNALLVDGERFAWAVPFAAVGLPAVLALYGGLAALLYHRLRPRGWLRAPVLAGAWTLAEMLRGTIATGFPWNLPASAWSFSDALMQPLALFGAYGYGFFVLLFALSPLLLLRSGAGRLERGIGICSLLLPLLFLVFGQFRLDAAMPLDPAAPTVRVVQGNIPQRDKWNPELIRGHVAKYAMLTRLREADAVPAGFGALPPARLVVWPETAIPYALNREPQFAAYLGSLLPPGDAVLMTGAPLREAIPGYPEATRNYNAVVALDRTGRIIARHDKFHLVPFGEYVPFSEWLPLGPVVKTGQGFTPGPGPGSFEAPGLPPIGSLICYEVIFPGAVTAPAGPRPGLLVNVTNDAWFGFSSGPYQHLAAARMRAVEEGIPIIRAANTGISAIIDAYGRVLASLPLERTGAIDSPLPPALPSKTLYARVGDSLAIVLALLPLLAAFLRRAS
ncbi:MAG: apolipoprotein N-acyltransferase [Nisaea sp.]|uniref:apolipoprotein N-acyltransferase n=1 Tax=Nisaea sp. TaxID=2024842 RepID=UPI001B1E217F|nr:apolipoprotein N-acyltransferase [Nisaea sp.]MBO6560516.1 apolipoprotein N-acyltransferase [Nisaea sp.]